jgi:MerR family transcriptional regulator, light-induced transcriptional regulator
MADVTVWQTDDRPEFGQRSCGRAARLDAPLGSPMSSLLRTIEGEIVPRLMLALQSAPAAVASEGVARSAPGEEEVSEFARLVVTHDLSVASAYVNALLNRGVPLEMVYLELLAPAARLLGEWWKQDVRNFADVTSGLCRMHQLLHEFSPAFQYDAQPTAPDRCILLVPMPGEQHSFGLIMVSEFFRRDGWDVWDLHPSSATDLMGVVRKQWFSVIGLSLSCESRLSEVAPLLSEMRQNSKNPAVALIVGGLPFIGHPERVNAVGADATASDGRRATIEAGRLLSRMGRRA